jgi:hypothetical protein
MLNSEMVLLRFELPKGAVFLNIAVYDKSRELVGTLA